MKKIMLFIGLFTFVFLGSNIINVRAEDVRELKYRDIIQPTTAGNIYYSYLVFPTDMGNEELVYRFENNMQSYFSNDTVEFTPTRSNIDQYNANYGYSILNHNQQVEYDILEFDYIEINNTTISFYLNNAVIYNTDLADVFSIMHFYGTSVPDFPDFPNDPNDPEVPGDPYIPGEYDSIDNIKLLEYYEVSGGDNYIIFNTNEGEVTNLNSFKDNLDYYFELDKVIFLPTIKAVYQVIGVNSQVINFINDFDYLEITDTSITFYYNDDVLYNALLENVDTLVWEYDENFNNNDYETGFFDAMEFYQQKYDELLIINKQMANHYKAIGFNDGYRAGKQEHSDDFSEGYDAGASESFISGIDKWIVPAIIIVLLLGGFIAMNKMKKGDL